MKAYRLLIKVGMGEKGLSLLETLFALVLIGMGLMAWSKMQGMSWGQNRSNANTLRAGQLIEKDVEGMRLRISRDTLLNWPPRDSTYLTSDQQLTFVRTVSEARSPINNLVLTNVRKIDIAVSWGNLANDTMKITTYVTRRF
jgi:Tfp pilus assembly protein PilV